MESVLKTEAVVFRDRLTYQRLFAPSLPEIRGDQDHIHEAISNLVRNASEAALRAEETP